MKQYFKQLFAYDKWANRLLFEKFEQQFPQNPRIYQVLSHMLSAQRIWFERAAGIPQSVAVWSERLPEEIKADIENYNLAWIDFIDQLEESDFEKTTTYTNSQGHTFTDTLTDMIVQVLNHGTHHRGGLMVMMKEEGYVLPMLDYIAYVRSN